MRVAFSIVHKWRSPPKRSLVFWTHQSSSGRLQLPSLLGRSLSNASIDGAVDSVETIKPGGRILLFDGAAVGRQHMMVSSLAIMQMVFWGVNNGMQMALPVPVNPQALEVGPLFDFMTDPIWMSVGTGLSFFFFFYAKKFADQSICRVELSNDSSRAFVTSHKLFGGLGVEHTCSIGDVHIKNRKAGMISLHQPWKWGFMVIDEGGGTFHNEKIFMDTFDKEFAGVAPGNRMPINLDAAYKKLRRTKKNPSLK